MDERRTLSSGFGSFHQTYWVLHRNPAPLLMDNNDSHCSLGVADIARENGLTIITFPPHCSHMIKPLNVSVYVPVKKHYNAAVNELNLSHPGRGITILYDLPACARIHERLSFAIKL